MSKKIIDLGNLTEYDEQIKGYIANQIPSLTGYEQTANKVTSLSSSSTDTQYPSAKSVYDYVEDNKFDYVIYANETEISLDRSNATITINSEPLLTQLNQILTDGLFDAEGHIKDLKIALHIMDDSTSIGSRVFNDYLYILTNIHASQDGRYDTKSFTFVFNGTDVEYNDYLALGYYYGDGGSGIITDAWEYIHYGIADKITNTVNNALSNYVKAYKTMPNTPDVPSGTVVQYVGTQTSPFKPGYFYRSGGTYWSVALEIPEIQYTTMPTANRQYNGKIAQYIGTTNANYTNGYFYKCVSDGAASPTYSWEQYDVQPSGGDAWDYVLSTTNTFANTGSSTWTTISDDSFHILNQLNQIITDGLYESSAVIKPLRIALRVADTGCGYYNDMYTLQSIDIDETQHRYQFSFSNGYNKIIIRCLQENNTNNWSYQAYSLISSNFDYILDAKNVIDLKTATLGTLVTVSNITLKNQFGELFYKVTNGDWYSSNVKPLRIGLRVKQDSHGSSSLGDNILLTCDSYGWNSDDGDDDFLEYHFTGSRSLYERYDITFKSFSSDWDYKLEYVIREIPLGEQLLVMPSASYLYRNKTVQYIGPTNNDYIHGYFYDCVYNSSNYSYSWQQCDVQPSSGGGSDWDYVLSFDINNYTTWHQFVDSSTIDQLNAIVTNGLYDGSRLKKLKIAILGDSGSGIDYFYTLQSITTDEDEDYNTRYHFWFSNKESLHLAIRCVVSNSNNTNTWYYRIYDSTDLFIEKYTTMPNAGSYCLDKIVQYIGTTDANYTNGYFYKCVSDGQATPTYSWVEYQVQSPAPMYIMSYGHSTWDDFITAYNKRLLVYCRASSSSNPATGSQTRMAFMAYVNSADSPTEVEFQYYRSVSSHSASQQGDQVFVYKLNKTNGWSVTTREASSKIVAGTNMTSSYSNGVITLNATSSGEANTIDSISVNGTALTPDANKNVDITVQYNDLSNKPFELLGSIDDFNTSAKALDIDNLTEGTLYAISNFRDSGSLNYLDFYYKVTGLSTPSFTQPQDVSWWRDENNYKYLVNQEEWNYQPAYDPMSEYFDDMMTYEYVTNNSSYQDIEFWLDYYANPPEPTSVTQVESITIGPNGGGFIYLIKNQFTGQEGEHPFYLQWDSTNQDTLYTHSYSVRYTGGDPPFEDDSYSRYVNGLSGSAQTFYGKKTFNTVPETSGVATSENQITNLKTVNSQVTLGDCIVAGIKEFVGDEEHTVGSYRYRTYNNITKLYRCKTYYNTTSWSSSKWEEKTLSDYYAEYPRDIYLGTLTFNSGVANISSSDTNYNILKNINIGTNIKISLSGTTSEGGSFDTSWVNIRLTSQQYVSAGYIYSGISVNPFGQTHKLGIRLNNSSLSGIDVKIITTSQSV